MNQNISLPVGEHVESVGTMSAPEKKTLSGQFVALSPINPENDVDDLYECSHGSHEIELLWTYMAYGPFSTKEQMQNWLTAQGRLTDPLFYVVFDKQKEKRVGMCSMMNIHPAMRCLETGHIWYAPQAQNTKINTETVYLMLSEAFDQLNYRRVEWKCDSLNKRSRKAALRLGFTFEGIFRQHLIVKGRNRDTAWFSLLDHEWEFVKKNMESWLYGEKDCSLSELNAKLHQ